MVGHAVPLSAPTVDQIRAALVRIPVGLDTLFALAQHKDFPPALSNPVTVTSALLQEWNSKPKQT